MEGEQHEISTETCMHVLCCSVHAINCAAVVRSCRLQYSPWAVGAAFCGGAAHQRPPAVTGPPRPALLPNIRRPLAGHSQLGVTGGALGAGHHCAAAGDTRLAAGARLRITALWIIANICV